MTTLLPILLALGMHPAQTTCHLEGATPVGCVAMKADGSSVPITVPAPEKAAAHDPGCTCPVAQVCRGTSDGDGIPHTKEDCEGGGGVWDAVPPANTTACALPHCTPTEPPLFMSNATTLFPAHPKPKREAKLVVPERKWAICAYDGADGSILSCAVDAHFLFSPDKHPEGVGDSKQPAPVLAQLEKDAHEAKWWFLIGLGGLWFMHIAGFIADRRIGAHIINAILGTDRSK